MKKKDIKKIIKIQRNWKNILEFRNDIVKELKFVSKRQLSGDIIICDDYTITQFPEICKAIDEFLSIGEYKSKIFYGNDGNKERGYVYMVKI